MLTNLCPSTALEELGPIPASDPVQRPHACAPWGKGRLSETRWLPTLRAQCAETALCLAYAAPYSAQCTQNNCVCDCLPGPQGSQPQTHLATVQSMRHTARSIGGTAITLVWLFVVAVMLIAAHWAGSGPTQGSTSSRRWSPQLRPRLAREEEASATLSTQQLDDNETGPSEAGITQHASHNGYSRPPGQAPQKPHSTGPAVGQGSAAVQHATAPGGGSSGGASPDSKEAGSVANPLPAATGGSSAVAPAPAAASNPAAASTSADMLTHQQEPSQQQQKQQTARKAAASLGMHSASISMQHVIPQALEQGKQGQVRVGGPLPVLAPWQLRKTPEALHVAPLRHAPAPGRGAVRAAARATSQHATGAAESVAVEGARQTCTAEADAAVLCPCARKLDPESCIHGNISDSGKCIRCAARCLLVHTWQCDLAPMSAAPTP